MAYDKAADALIQNGTLTSESQFSVTFNSCLADPWPSLAPAMQPALLAAAASRLAGSNAVVMTTASQNSTAAMAGASISSGLTISASFDPNHSGPAGFQAAVATAVQFLESQFTNQITINIDLGWGTVGSHTIGSGAAGENWSSLEGYYGYSRIEKLLNNAATSPTDISAVSNLPSADPLAGSSGDYYELTTANAKALGVSSSTSFDAYIALNSGLSYTFDPTNGVASSTYDAVGILEHEITEAMGRIAAFTPTSGTAYYDPLNLFRYASAGSITAAAGTSAYFSTDGGQTSLLPFNTNSGSDPNDWATSAAPDAFTASVAAGTRLTVSTTDLQVMDVLGYTLACFTAGTAIAAEHGAIRVEAVRPGDRVRTQSGALAQVRWIGHRRIDCSRHPDPSAAQPIRITAHAFAPGRPARDLWLSPDHAVALDSVLIPIRLLANGGSIAQDTEIRQVHYFHVELDRHDVLLAEGLPAESYLDTGNRGIFANADVPPVLHPDLADAQARREGDSCLPLLLDPAKLEPVWRSLARRSEQLGLPVPEVATTTDPALHLLVGGRRIGPAARTGDRWCFAVPDLAAGARLISRQVVPTRLRPWVEDRRQLGVMVRRITLFGPDGHQEVALDDPRLSSGWWAPETDGATLWRWSNGNATLLPLASCHLLELRLGVALEYPVSRADPTLARQTRRPVSRVA